MHHPILQYKDSAKFSADDFDAKYEEIEAVARPIISRAYRSSGNGSSGTEGSGFSSTDNGGSSFAESDDFGSGPEVEEAE
jgi:hypothetical protein